MRANQGDEHQKAIMARYSKFIAMKRHQANWNAVLQDEIVCGIFPIPMAGPHIDSIAGMAKEVAQTAYPHGRLHASNAL